MKTLIRFTWASWRLIRAVGRNPLVRMSDRLEAAVLILVFTVSLAAVLVAVAAGDAVHTQCTSAYAEQAQSRQRTLAAVTHSWYTTQRAGLPIVVSAQWRVGDREHTGTFTWGAPVEVGDTIDIWVNRDGSKVGAPPPAWRADVNAVVIGIVTWLLCVVAAAALFAAVRYWFDRVRYAAWDREISSLVEWRESS